MNRIEMVGGEPGNTVADLMTPDPLTIEASATVEEAMEVMASRRFRHLPVMNGDVLVGLLTHRDLARMQWPDDEPGPEAVSVSSVMHRDPEVVGMRASATAAARHLLMQKQGCLLVVDGRALVGVLTESDFLRAYIRAN